MLVQAKPPLHLTYCLNVHPGESWEAQQAAMRQHTQAVRARIAPGRPFGVGLRLGKQAADFLSAPERRRQARYFLDTQQLYAFTLNAFPYGAFHQTAVKERVYAPDWRSAERLAYTRQLADILADLLPRGQRGSLSTLPGSYKPWVQHAPDRRLIVHNLRACAEHLARLEEKTGRELHLGLEPEPGCLFETVAETVAFFEQELFATARDAAELERLRRHLGVCVDTCHVAMAFEDPAEALQRYRAAGIRISKIQLSAALAVPTREAAALALFQEPVYLHQAAWRGAGGERRAWPDLPALLAAPPPPEAGGELRVHFHVPLFFQEFAPYRSTVGELGRKFWELVREGVTEHLEIETYTFDVLPEALRPAELAASLAREYQWVLERV